MNISVDCVKKLLTKKTKAIICMHYVGLPCDLDELQALANKYKIPLIEDAAHAIGATYKKKLIWNKVFFRMSFLFLLVLQFLFLGKRLYH